ncbi:MAG TPA: SMP-30/gluconolactonase/LRE family protein [Candidatus Limnocylindria bacterium]|jgi:sugar lactone lactonase YvrE|nr:SMP-30/gluconolactonase/LRE family protein [Candidatus Limnocylindria bacterium]
MRRWLISLVAALMLTSAQPVLAAQPEEGVVRTIADTSGTTCNNPEGIAASPDGLLYAAGLSGNICVYTLSGGDPIRVIPVAKGHALLGELFVAGQGIYVADNNPGFSGGRLIRVDPASGAVTELATGFLAPNAITQDHHGTLYVSDSFAGAVYTVSPDGGGKTLWKADPLLLPMCPPFCPGFGANGVAFDRTQSNLYVANTSRDRILRIEVNKDGSAGAVSIFADGATLGPDALNGADGIQFDVKGNLYVCANQANEIQVLSPSGALVARYGKNPGDDSLDFPASPIFHERGLYIANLALGTPGKGRISVLGVPFPGAPIAH